MQLKLFILPIKNLAAPEAEMNGFLRAHRLLAVKKELTAKNAKNAEKNRNGGNAVTAAGPTAAWSFPFHFFALSAFSAVK